MRPLTAVIYFQLLMVVLLALAGSGALMSTPLVYAVAEFAEEWGMDGIGELVLAGSMLVTVSIPVALIYWVRKGGGATALGWPQRRGTPAQRQNTEGVALLERGAFQAAIAAFTEALQLDPQLGAAYYNRSVAYQRLNQLNEAEADLDAAVRLRPDWAAIFIGRANLWYQRGEHELALAECETAVRLEPANAAALTCRGNILLVRSEYDRALADFERAVFYQPKHAHAYRGQALCWAARGEINKALGYANQAIAFGGDATDFAVRGAIWLQRNDLDRALADLDTAIHNGAAGASVYRDRGLAWLLKGDYKQALADTTQALRLDAHDAVAFNNRGTIHLKMGSYRESLLDLQQAQQLDPQLPNTYKNLAWLQATCPQPEFRDGVQAVAHATRALELTQWKTTEWLPILAAAHAEAGQFDVAVQWQTRFLEGAPAEAEAQARLEHYRAGQPLREVVGVGEGV